MKIDNMFNNSLGMYFFIAVDQNYWQFFSLLNVIWLSIILAHAPSVIPTRQFMNSEVHRTVDRFTYISSNIGYLNFCVTVFASYTPRLRDCNSLFNITSCKSKGSLQNLCYLIHNPIEAHYITDRKGIADRTGRPLFIMNISHSSGLFGGCTSRKLRKEPFMNITEYTLFVE